MITMRRTTRGLRTVAKVKMNQTGISARIPLLLGLLVTVFVLAEGLSGDEVHQQQDAFVRSVQEQPNYGVGSGEPVSKELGAKHLAWVASGNGHVPEGAVVGGRTASGETLYIGRVYHKDDLIPGKIHPSNKRLYIAHAGKEHGFYNYEVLVELPKQLPAM